MQAVQCAECVGLEYDLQGSTGPEHRKETQNRIVALHGVRKHSNAITSESEHYSTCSPHSLPPHALRPVAAVQEAKVLTEAVLVSFGPAQEQSHTHCHRDNDAPEDDRHHTQAQSPAHVIPTDALLGDIADLVAHCVVEGGGGTWRQYLWRDLVDAQACKEAQ